MNIFLGVVLLCHPYFLNFPQEETFLKFREFALSLTDGNFNRIGKDSFFIFMAPVFVIIGRDLRAFPRGLAFLMLTFLSLAFFNTENFFAPSVFYQTVMIATGATIFTALYKKADNQTEDIFHKCMATNALIFSFWIIAEHFGIEPYRLILPLIGNFQIESTHDVSHVVGPLGHPNLSGAYLALTIPSILRIGFHPLLLLVGIALFLCSSHLPVMTAIGVVLAYLFYKYINGYKWLPFAVFSALGILLYFTGVGGVDNQRFAIWKQALSLDFNHIIGSGTGFFATQSQNHVKHAHNEFIEVFLSYGLVGLGLLFFALKRALRTDNRYALAGLFGVFVNFYGNFTFHVSVLAFIGICYYVFCLKKYIEVENV